VTQAKKTNADAPQANWTWWLSILSRSTPTVLWETQLPGIPLQDGTAIARDGTILVAFKNGDVYGYGTGTAVSVAARELRMQQPAPESRTASDGWAMLPAPGAGNGGMRASDAQRRWGADAARPQPQAAEARSVVLLDGPAPLSRPLATNTVLLADGSRAPMHQVTPSDPQGLAFHPRSMRWSPERECLRVASVTASSAARGREANSTIDRDLTTRWTSSTTGPQSITYDLGISRTVAAATIVWYAPRQSRVPYTIAVSLDGKRFSPVDEGALSGRGTNSTLRTFLPTDARYVRVTLGSPVSVYEAGIHGAIVGQYAER